MRRVWWRRLWVSLLWFAGIDLVGGFISAVSAALTDSSRLGNLTAVLVLSGIGVLFVCGCSADAVPERRTRPSREDRRRLRAEESRIALDARILQAEREVGLRDD